MRISSTRNPVVGYVRSLGRTQIRREEGVYLVEGVRLVREAAATGQPATLVLYDPDLLTRSAAGPSLLSELAGWAERSYEVDERVLRAAAQTEQPAGVLAVLNRPEPPPLSSLRDARFGLILDGLGDPGNAGTILRTSAATGVEYVVALPGTVDLFSPKVVRAGMGAHFRLALYGNVQLEELRAALPESQLVAVDAGGEESVCGFRWPDPAALVVGGEAHGLSPAARLAVTHTVQIPMREGVESLNAAVAASIALYAALGPSLSSTSQQRSR